MIKMSNKAKQAARALAVSYNAFMKAVNEDDNNGKCVWGRILIHDQNLLDINIIGSGNIEDVMRHADKFLEEKAASEVGAVS